MPLQPGARLGPYEIELALGSGGMGEVYRARDTRLHRAVAIKVLHQAAGVDATRKIMIEARAAARLNHPNIATLHDVIEQDGNSFLVMEFVDGESLRATIATGPAPIERVLDLMIQLADALAYAHREGVVHRDVKPANVVVTRDGQLKLLDLGIAQAVASAPGEDTRTGTDEHLIPRRIGTPEYMAPEQLSGRAASARSDIYSAGVLCYELLTAKRPFEAPDMIGLAVAIASQPVPRPSESRPQVPAAIDTIVQRAMSRDVADRYESAGAMRDDLVRVREAMRTGEIPDLAQPVRWWSRPSTRIAAAVVVVALIGSLALDRWYFGRHPGSVALLPALNASEDPTVEALGATIVSTLNDNLASIPGAARVSGDPASYRGRERDVRQAPKALGAAYVVDLQLRKVGDAFGAEAQIMGAGSDKPLWRAEYAGDSFAIMSGVVTGVAAALTRRGVFATSLSADERERLQHMPTADAAALDGYLRGRAILDGPPLTLATGLEGVTALEKATGRDQNFALAYAGLGYLDNLLFGITGDRAWSEKAGVASKRALDIDPSRAVVQETAARLDQSATQLDAAERHAREAIKIAPDSDSPHRLLAAILNARQNRTGAIEQATIAARLRPTSAAVQYALGFYLLQAGRYRDAITPLTRATELQSDSPDYFSTLGIAYHNVGDIKQAIGNYAQAVRLGPNARAYSNLGTAYYWAGDFKQAVANYREALTLQPASSTTHRNLADAYERLGQTTRSRAEYQESIARADAWLADHTQDVREIAQKAFCEAKLGQLDAAQRDIAAALTLSKRTSADVVFKSAVILTLAGQKEAALKELAEALKLGYNVTFARDDWDLRALKDHPTFTQLVNRQGP